MTRRNGKLGVEGGGGAPVITINNYTDSSVTARPGADPQEIEIVIQRLSDDVIRGGTTISNSFEQTYGLQRRGL